MNPQIPTTNCWAAIVFLANECGVFVLISNRNMKILVLLTLLISIIFSTGCIEKQETGNTNTPNQQATAVESPSIIPPFPFLGGTEIVSNETTDTKSSSEAPMLLPLPVSDYDWDDWEFDDISALSSGFAVGNNPDGYNLPSGSIIYRLPCEFVKVFGPDNKLILSFNDDDIKVMTIVPGGGGRPPASGLIGVPNGAVVDTSKFIMIIKPSPCTNNIMLQSVNLRKSCDNISIKAYDNWFLGAWSGIAGDVGIDSSLLPQLPIYAFDHFLIEATANPTEVKISWQLNTENKDILAQTGANRICFQTDGYEVSLFLYDKNTIFITFYNENEAFVKRLLKAGDSITYDTNN